MNKIFFCITALIFNNSVLMASMHLESPTTSVRTFGDKVIADWEGAQEYLAINSSYATARDNKNYTPLHYLLDKQKEFTQQHVVIAKPLIAASADCNAVGTDNYSLFHAMANSITKHAALSEKTLPSTKKILALLLEHMHKETINLCFTITKETGLEIIIAHINGNDDHITDAQYTKKSFNIDDCMEQCIDMLIEAGATTTNDYYNLDIFHMALNGSLALTKLALKQLPEKLNWQGLNKKELETLKEKYSDIKIFRAKLINPWAKDYNFTPLHCAVRGLVNSRHKDRNKIVQYLLTQKADATLTDANNELPLHAATRVAHKNVLKILLDHDNSLVNAKSKDNSTPLHMAAQNGHSSAVENIQLLIENRADINVQDDKGNTPLHYALSYGLNLTSKALLLLQYNPTIMPNNAGDTPLHLAAKIKNSPNLDAISSTISEEDVIKIIDIILERSPESLNLQNNSCNTATHIATQDDCINNLNALLKYKPNLTIKNGRTPLELAQTVNLNAAEVIAEYIKSNEQ